MAPLAPRAAHAAVGRALPLPQAHAAPLPCQLAARGNRASVLTRRVHTSTRMAVNSRHSSVRGGSACSSGDWASGACVCARYSSSFCANRLYMSSCGRSASAQRAARRGCGRRALRSSASSPLSTTWRSRCSRVTVAASPAADARSSPCRSSVAFSDSRRPRAATLCARASTTSSSTASATLLSRGAPELDGVLQRTTVAARARPCLPQTQWLAGASQQLIGASSLAQHDTASSSGSRQRQRGPQSYRTALRCQQSGAGGAAWQRAVRCVTQRPPPSCLHSHAMSSQGPQREPAPPPAPPVSPLVPDDSKPPLNDLTTTTESLLLRPPGILPTTPLTQ